MTITDTRADRLAQGWQGLVDAVKTALGEDYFGSKGEAVAFVEIPSEDGEPAAAIKYGDDVFFTCPDSGQTVAARHCEEGITYAVLRPDMGDSLWSVVDAVSMN